MLHRRLRNDRAGGWTPGRPAGSLSGATLPMLPPPIRVSGVVATVEPSLAAAAGAARPGLTINVLYDASVDAAPAAFKTAFAAAVQFFESNFTDPVTITLEVGFGSVGSLSLDATALGETWYYTDSYSYA